MKTYIYIIIFLFSVLAVNSQLVYNNGAVVHINTGLVVQVNGDLENAAGTITNNGDIFITNNITNNSNIDGDGNYNISGNWINNGIFSAGASTVFLEGATQSIAGTVSTTFNNLELTGTGIKTLQINTGVNNTLALNDRELATDIYTMFVLSSNTNAITRTTGFVSSLSNGSLSRNTLNTATYEFPVGSSLGTQRYRPVAIIPATASANTFTVCMVNNDATNDGYDRTLIDTTLCAANPDFYHKINRTAGSDAADISIFYDELTDGIWTGIAQWQTVPSNIWQSTGPSTLTSGSPLSNVSISGWNNFTTDPYILTIELPVVDLGPDTFFCTGSFVTVDAGAGYDSYIWSDGTTTTQTIDINVADLYYVTVTSQGCTAVDDIKIDEYPPPLAETVPDTSLCEGNSAQLTATGGIYYQWSTSDTTSTINVSPTITTTYWVTVSNNYCSDTDSVTVTVYPLPVADAGNDQTVCTGDTVVLTANGGTNYEWSTGSLSQTISITPVSSTYYYVTVSENNCADVDSVLVTVVSSITADAGVNQTICQGDSTTLSATGGNTYIWSTMETSQDINVSPSNTTTYFVTATTGSCTDIDSVTVNVNSLPVADAGPGQTVCQGSSTTLTATGGTSYVWSTSQTGATISVTPASQTTYYVTVTLNGCSNTDSVTIDINPLPVADAGNDQTICENETVILSATGGTSYVWSNGDTNASTQVTPSNTTIYYVTVTDNNSCTATDDIVVNVLTTPNAFAGQDVTICKGDTTQLFASGGSIYTWNNSTGLSDPNINNPYVFPATTTMYVVTVSNGTCEDYDTVYVQVNPLPYISTYDTTINISEDVHLIIPFNQEYDYIWTPSAYLNNPYILDPVINVEEPGDYYYTVQATDSNGCKSYGHVYIYTLDKLPGDLVIYNTFTPNGDLVNDFWVIDNIDKYPDNVIKVYNRNGHVVFESTNYNNDWDGKYYGNNLPAATYYYVIDLGDGSPVITGDVTIIR